LKINFENMKFRIHGDNIIECERALNLLALSFEAETILKTNRLLVAVFYSSQ